MRIRLLGVGRPRDGETARLHDDYAQRIRRFGVRYDADSVREVRPGGKYSDDHVRRREADHLLQALEDKGTWIALDRTGEELSSEELSRSLERWASPLASLVLGGPLGLHRSMLERARYRWSLSRLTLPHELARVIVAEQLYRALTLLRGVPYHK